MMQSGGTHASLLLVANARLVVSSKRSGSRGINDTCKTVKATCAKDETTFPWLLFASTWQSRVWWVRPIVHADPTHFHTLDLSSARGIIGGVLCGTAVDSAIVLPRFLVQYVHLQGALCVVRQRRAATAAPPTRTAGHASTVPAISTSVNSFCSKYLYKHFVLG